MQEAADAIREGVTVGFWRGVARAREGGLDVSGVLKNPDDLINTITRIMTDIKNEMVEKDPKNPIWHQRAVKHAAENITTFEVAWRREQNPSSNSMKDEDMKGYLNAFRTRGNCWSHDR